MSDELERGIEPYLRIQDRSIGALERLADVAQPTAVFAAPVTAGEYTIVSAAEVSMGFGFGFGAGGGHGTSSSDDEPTPNVTPQTDQGVGMGGGGGGGGGAMSRPVAVIAIGPQGVKVEPVLDTTKLSLALLTMVGGILLQAGRIWQASRK